MEKRKTTHHLLRSPHVFVVAGVFCLVALGAALGVQIVRAEGRILPNVTMGGIEIGGLEPAEAEAKLREALRAVNITGLAFSYGDRSMTIKAVEKGSAVASPVTYDVAGMAQEAFAYGHDGETAEFLVANVRALVSTVDLPVRVTVDDAGLRDLLELRFSSLEKPARDADVEAVRRSASIEAASGTPAVPASWDVEVVPASTGVRLDYASAIDEAARGLDRWQGASLALRADVAEPAVTTAEAEAAVPRVQTVLARGEAMLAYDDMTWAIPEKSLADALTLRRVGGDVRVTLRKNMLFPLFDEAAKTVESEAKPTKFRLDEKGRAVDFQGGSLGKHLDRETSLVRVDELFEASENGVIPLAVETYSSGESDPIAEELGVLELLGYGTSNFAGSPTNRRKNIANGAARLNGIVIKPGEEIGLLDFLKPFDASGGWLQELVIKGNRTVPEYGGGLCQIGTTVFRSVMGAGLPVTERQNHSFRVRYYEPAGTDATLYEPAPDFKFMNDTDHHAILVTHVVKDLLRFELWGTRDGRVQKQGKVTVWDIKPPPEAKLIETSDLAEGVKKCFEKPVSGAKTSFDYVITYPDGRVVEKEFRSVYKPWQEQCLIGKVGAPRLSMQKDGSIKELPPATPAVSPAPAPGTPQPPAIN